MTAKAGEEGKTTYISNNSFMLEPIALLYTSVPTQVRSRFKEQISRFQGFAQSTAALSSQLSPSSPRYCLDQYTMSLSPMTDHIEIVNNKEDLHE